MYARGVVSHTPKHWKGPGVEPAVAEPLAALVAMQERIVGAMNAAAAPQPLEQVD